MESAAARVCREAGGRVRTNLLMREMDGAPNVEDCRRLEVVVDGLPLFGGRQIAVDTTLVGALHRDGSPRRGAADRDGVALTAARKRKEDRYPGRGQGLAHGWLSCRLKLAGGGQPEASSFVSQLAVARARQEVPQLRKRAEQAWRLRWGAILACASGRAVVESLLGLSGSMGCDGLSPTTDHVVADHRYCA